MRVGQVIAGRKLHVLNYRVFAVKVVLPGNNKVGGFWPGIWAFGNLGRPGESSCPIVSHLVWAKKPTLFIQPRLRSYNGRYLALLLR
jgi:hypothetical protein